MSTKKTNPKTASNKTNNDSALRSIGLFSFSYIPKKGLENLKSYKYQGKDLSIIANYVLQPFWRWLVEYLPEWMAYVFAFLF
jgi:hypothetical protein